MMSTAHKKLLGVVINSVLFKDSSRIVTIISSEGPMTFQASISKKQPEKNLAISPLVYGEYTLSSKSQGYYFLKEYTIIDTFQDTRKSLPSLTAAGKMLAIIRKTQASQDPSQIIFPLLLSFLQRLKQSKKPQTLLSSFMLKALKSEGVFLTHSLCSICKKDGSTSFVSGSIFCDSCAPKGAIVFTIEEWNTLLTLSHSTSFKAIEEFDVSDNLNKKVELFLEDALR